MTDEILFETLQQAIQEPIFDLTKIKEILLDFKKTSGQQAIAQRMIEDLRISFENNENFEDRTLEVLDLIVGWSNPKFRIWQKYRQPEH